MFCCFEYPTMGKKPFRLFQNVPSDLRMLQYFKNFHQKVKKDCIYSKGFKCPKFAKGSMFPNMNKMW